MPISNTLFDSLKKSGGLVSEKPAASSGGDGSDAFFDQASPIADRIGKNIGVSPRVAAALMALETGWGKSVIPGTNNWGNIKDFSGSGVAAKDNITGTRDKYRAYGSGEEFADDFSSLMKRKYPDAVGVGDDAKAFADALRRGGYAEDPAHAQKIIKIADGLKNRFGGGSSAGTKWADDKAIPRDDGRPGAQSKSDAHRAGPTVGDAVKTFGASAVSGLGDMAQGLIGEPMAWLANKAAGTEEFEGKNLLAGVADSIRDGMTEGGKLAREDAPTGDVFQPDTWKLPETTGGILMIGADGLGSLIPSIVPFAGQAGRAASLAKAAKAAELAGDAQKASHLAVQAERASRIAKTAGAAGGFGMTGGAAAAEVRQNVERELQDRTHDDLVQSVPLYRDAFAQTGDAKMARQAVINGAAQYATLFSGAMGAVGGGVNAALLEEVLVKRGVAAAVGRISGSKAVHGTVGATAGGFGEGVQEVSEKIGQNAGENVGLGRPSAQNVSRDSFGDFVGGAMVGGPVGGLGGGAFRNAPTPTQTKAAPIQPTIKPNSPLSNAAGIAQAAQANAAARSNLAIQQQALADQEAASSGGATAVDPSAAAQDAIRRRLMAAQREAASQQDYSSAEDAENEIGQATGIDQQEQILEFNRLLAEEQASLAEQRGDIAEAQRIRSAEMASREAIRTSRARNGVGKPSGSFGQMNEFADLLSEEQADIESRRADAASRRKLQAESELQAADARVSAQMAREAESRRREVLAQVIAEGISSVNPVADVEGRFSAELQRQGYRDTKPTDTEAQSILRAVDVANAREDGSLPSLPNEADFYKLPKPTRAPVQQKADPQPKQQPNRRLTPKEVREYVAASAILNGDTLTLRDGTTIKLKGPQIAAAREAIRKAQPAQAQAKAIESTEVVQVPTGELAGEKIDSEWTAFTPETGTLGVPRDDMPQIKAEHRGAMTNFMNARGVGHRAEEVPAETLRPTQAEFSPKKVKRAMEYLGGDRSILVSSDDYVLDGHHQWLARREAGDPIKIIRLDAPIADLIPLALAFPSSTTTGDTKQGLDAAIKILMDRTDGNGSPDGLIGPENADARVAIVAALAGKKPEDVAADPAAKLKTAVPQVERLLYDAAKIPGETIKDRRAAFLDWLDGASRQSDEKAASLEPVASELFATFEQGASALRVLGNPGAIRSRLADAGIKFLPRNDGAAIPQKDAQKAALRTVPVSIDRYKVPGVPDRLSNITLEVMENGEAVLISPAESSRHKNAETALQRYVESYSEKAPLADEGSSGQAVESSRHGEQEKSQDAASYQEPINSADLPAEELAEPVVSDAAAEKTRPTPALSSYAPPSDLAAIFAGLSSRGLAKSRARKAAASHRRSAQIAYVQDNFHNILAELEDKGLVKINCD